MPLACFFSGLSDGFADFATGANIRVVEVVVLALNKWRCPLTALAARYTTDRRANFDIYLPEWLAKHNKVIFGTIYLVGVVIACAHWVLAAK